jgi:hypothetical protein
MQKMTAVLSIVIQHVQPKLWACCRSCNWIGSLAEAKLGETFPFVVNNEQIVSAV